jgi:hypothetical protein
MTYEDIRKAAAAAILAERCGLTDSVARALAEMGVELLDESLDGWVTVGVKTRHALAECSKCGEQAMQPSTTTRDGLPKEGKRCFMTSGCQGRMLVPSIPRRPRG